MRHQPDDRAGWPKATAAGGLPAPLDSETNALLRLFLVPILETAPDWGTLARALAAKGYALCFREGHLVILNGLGEALCTGSALGVPMARIAARIGRPCVRAHRDGHSGELGRA
jgi:hypothetical protein